MSRQREFSLGLAYQQLYFYAFYLGTEVNPSIEFHS